MNPNEVVGVLLRPKLRVTVLVPRERLSEFSSIGDCWFEDPSVWCDPDVEIDSALANALKQWGLATYPIEGCPVPDEVRIVSVDEGGGPLASLPEEGFIPIQWHPALQAQLEDVLGLEVVVLAAA